MLRLTGKEARSANCSVVAANGLLEPHTAKVSVLSDEHQRAKKKKQQPKQTHTHTYK
jgi:hypothetical protein